jgi:hypothetical protein
MIIRCFKLAGPDATKERLDGAPRRPRRHRYGPPSLVELLKHGGWTELIQWGAASALVTVLSFGKHRGHRPRTSCVGCGFRKRG